MSEKAYIQRLLDSFLADLRSVLPGCTEEFLCPLCLRPFSPEGVFIDELTEGHVWPRHIREQSGSKKANAQKVVLCKTCNSRAGSHGDKQMQLLERVKKGEESGRLWGERRIQVLLPTAEQPVELRGEVVRSHDKLDTQLKITRNRTSPDALARFKTLSERDETFTMLVYPPHELKPVLAQIGWITSAYLLAFYSLGYRYILQSDLDPVRSLVQASFTGNESARLGFLETDALGVFTCDIHFCDDPSIVLIVPLDGTRSTYLEISLFNYHIRLPFRCVLEPEMLLAILSLRDPGAWAHVAQDIGKAFALGIQIECSKANVHDCLWDYVLGKPIPAS